MITVYDDAPEENKETAEPKACEGDRRRLYLRAVGEPAEFAEGSGGIFTGGEYSHACRLQASLTRSARRMRTHHRFAMMGWSHHRLGQKEKHRQPKRASYAFWSKRRDSNPRSPVPEQIQHRFLTTFVDFLMFFSPKTMLSDALVRTVST